MAAAAVALTPTNASATTYYVAPTGDDAAAGISPDEAWAALGRPSRTTLRPGDRLLLKGGATFRDGLTLDAGDAGDPALPVRIGSYGTGRAVIAPTAGNG